MISILRKIKNHIQMISLLKKWSRLPDASDRDVNPNYILTYDLLGIRNKHPIYCSFCGTEMIIRNTQLDWSGEIENLNLHIDLRFKCPNCDWWITFGIPIPKHYFLYLWQLRKKHGVGRTYAPIEEWKTKNEIKERLKKLGYW